MAVNYFLVPYYTLNPLKIHPKRMSIADKRMVNDHGHVDIKFPK